MATFHSNKREDLAFSHNQGKELFADKGYDSAMNRRICKSYGFKDRIYKRRTINGKRTHAKKSVVERYFSWHDKYRRLLVSYEQNVKIYLGMTSPNVAELIKKGYQVPQPKEKVNINTKRGLFRVTQTRNDLANDMQLLPHDEVVAIDPGFVRPIQMGIMNANTLMQSSALKIANKATQTSLTKQEWIIQQLLASGMGYGP